MIDHKGTKQIETARLLLRRFRADDAQAMYRNWASDPEVNKFLTWTTYTAPEAADEILSLWTKSYAKADFYQWAIVFKENGDEPIGSISAVHLDDRVEKAEIGYCIGRNWWHKGIMSEALGAVIAFMFEEVGMNRIESRHDPRNPHSGNVMCKCGMQYEGTARQADWNNQGICDACHYGILKSEFVKG